MAREKNVLTTGEVAKLCNVAARTVSKWFDSGQLRGYRIPGGKDRRIPASELIRFMRAHGIPLNGLEHGTKRVLVVDSDRESTETLRRALNGTPEVEFYSAATAFEAGMVAHERTPHVVIVSTEMADLDARAVVRTVRSLESLQGVKLIAMGSNLDDSAGQALLQEGFRGYLRKPFAFRALLELIEEIES